MMKYGNPLVCLLENCLVVTVSLPVSTWCSPAPVCLDSLIVLDGECHLVVQICV